MLVVAKEFKSNSQRTGILLKVNPWTRNTRRVSEVLVILLVQIKKNKGLCRRQTKTLDKESRTFAPGCQTFYRGIYKELRCRATLADIATFRS
jgi:hypothetical protein